MRHFILKPLIAALCIMAVTASCCDNENAGPSTDDSGWSKPPLPENDVIETRYTKPTAWFATEEHKLLGKLKARMENIVELDGNPSFVLLDEQAIPQLLADKAKMDKIQKLYSEGTAIGCINPAENWTDMLHDLEEESGHDDYKGKCQYDEMLSSFKSYALYIVRDNGQAFSMEREKTENKVKQTIVTTDTDEDGNTTTSTTTSVKTYNHTMNDYQIGRKAEMAVEWLNENTGTKLMSANFVKCGTRGQTEQIVNAAVIETFSPYMSFGHHAHYEYIPPTVPNTKVHVTVYALYSERHNKDLYNVELEVDYPAKETFIADDRRTRKKGAYKWRYAGLTYAGTDVTMYLEDEVGHEYNSTSVNIHGAVPRNEAGSYTVTHIPTGITLEGSISADIGSKGFGISPGFSAAFTLPSDQTTTTYQNMPVIYERSGGKANWTYDANGPSYSGPWGSNPTYHRDFPLISTVNCQTKHIALFAVDKSKNLEGKRLILYGKLTTRVKWANGGPWKGEDQKGTDTKDYELRITLPEMMRYFMKYTPSPYGAIADLAEWNALHEMFKNSNINYRALCDNSLQIGGVTEDKMKENASDIWNEVVDQLAREFEMTTTKNEYTVVLKDAKGNLLPQALLISNNGWKKIDL